MSKLLVINAIDRVLEETDKITQELANLAAANQIGVFKFDNGKFWHLRKSQVQRRVVWSPVDKIGSDMLVSDNEKQGPRSGIPGQEKY